MSGHFYFFRISQVLWQAHQVSSTGMAPGPSSAPLLLVTLPSAEAGARLLFQAAGVPALSLQLLLHLISFCFLPVLPLGLSFSTALLPSLTLCISHPFPRAKSSGVWVPLLCLTPFLFGSLVHLSPCWFWGPTQKPLRDPGWHLPSLLELWGIPPHLKGAGGLG